VLSDAGAALGVSLPPGTASRLKLRAARADGRTMHQIITALARAARSLTSLVAGLSTEPGQTMAEYGILIAVIALIVVVAATALGGSLSDVFHSAATKA
jgi:Flp pilus assembly pilin Flp